MRYLFVVGIDGIHLFQKEITKMPFELLLSMPVSIDTFQIWNKTTIPFQISVGLNHSDGKKQSMQLVGYMINCW